MWDLTQGQIVQLIFHLAQYIHIIILTYKNDYIVFHTKSLKSNGLFPSTAHFNSEIAIFQMFNSHKGLVAMTYSSTWQLRSTSFTSLASLCPRLCICWSPFTESRGFTVFSASSGLNCLHFFFFLPLLFSEFNFC